MVVVVVGEEDDDMLMFGHSGFLLLFYFILYLLCCFSLSLRLSLSLSYLLGLDAYSFFFCVRLPLIISFIQPCSVSLYTR